MDTDSGSLADLDIDPDDLDMNTLQLLAEVYDAGCEQGHQDVLDELADRYDAGMRDPAAVSHLLTDFYDMTYREAGEVRNTTHQSVGNQIQRARVALGDRDELPPSLQHESIDESDTLPDD